MLLNVEPYNYIHAKECIKNKVDAISLGQDFFSLRANYYFSDDQINDLINHKEDTKIFIKVNAIFFEQDLVRLTKYLLSLSKKNIDGVIFQDFAIAQINDENNLNLKLRYNPETLITSYFQFDFYQQANFKAVSLARELMLNEVQEILKNKQGLEIEIQGHGFLFIMHSRWNLISNFADAYKINLSHQLKIKEELRKVPNLIKQDLHGTHMYSGYQLYTFDILDQLIDLDWLRIDTYNLDEKEAFIITNKYQQAINLLNQDINAYKAYVNQEIDSFKNSLSSLASHSFLGKIKDILHMEKKDE